jgi:hypothetical protein
MRQWCGGFYELDDSRYCTHDCQSCRAICCKSPHRFKEMDRVGGPDFTDSRWVPFDLRLPPIIYQLNSQAWNIRLPAYIVSIKHLFYIDFLTWSREKDLRVRYKVPNESLIGISFCVLDKYLDEMLKMGYEKMADKIAEYKVDFVCGVNFSMYDNYPRWDHLVNLKRRFHMMKLLQERGVKVIPDYGWIVKQDFDRVLAWAKENQPSIVAFNFQTIHTTTTMKAWGLSVARMKDFEDRAGYPFKWVVFGASRDSRAKYLIANLKDVTIVDTKSYRYAEFHRQTVDRLWYKEDSPKDIFLRNAEHMDFVCDSAREGK